MKTMADFKMMLSQWLTAIAGAIIIVLQLITAFQEANILNLEKEIVVKVDRNYVDGTAHFKQLAELIAALQKPKE